MKRTPLTFFAALIFTLLLLALGYSSFGFWTMLIFSSGFLGGFIIWALLPINKVLYSRIKLPYWLTMGFFLSLHKVEENIFKFQEKLAEITGTPVPEITQLTLILLVVASVGAWLLIPAMLKRGDDFAYYLAWTFFSAMGITELAHFILPFFKNQPYGYFPGMASVLFLAPAAWWGMARLFKKHNDFI